MSTPISLKLPRWITSERARPWQLLALLVLVLVLAALYLSPRPRSFAINATTRAIDLTVVGASMSTWRLPDVLVCTRRGERLQGPGPTDRDGLSCDPRLYETSRVAELEMEWSPGTVLSVTRSGEGKALEVFVRDPAATSIDGTPLTAGSRLVVDGPAWAEGNSLTFSAQVVLGQVPGPGSQYNLMDGTFEIREATPTQSRAVPVMSGDLFPGDEVRIVGPEDDSVTSFGFIEPLDDSDPGFRVVAYTPPAQSVLRIDRFGAESIRVSPSWVDRALRDAIFTAVTTVSAFAGSVAALYAIVKGALSQPAPKPEPETKSAARPSTRRKPAKGSG